MEQNKKINESRAKIQNVMKTLKNTIRYNEAVDALVLSLVAREDVMLVGPRGAGFAQLVQALARLVQAQLVTTISTEEWPSDDRFNFLNRLVFIKIGPDAVLPPRLIERKNAWILIAVNEEGNGKEMQMPYGRFVKAFMQYLNGSDLISAVKARWLYEYPAIASMEDVKTLHEYATSLLRQESIVKSYYENVVTLVEALRVKHIAVGDEHVIETLPRLYAAYLAIHGASPENMIGAAYEILPYIAQTREELSNMKKVIDERFGEIATLVRLLNDGKQQLEIGDVRGALEAFHEVAAYDANHLPPGLKQNAEDLINAANKYIEKIQKLIDVMRGESKTASSK